MLCLPEQHKNILHSTNLLSLLHLRFLSRFFFLYFDFAFSFRNCCDTFFYGFQRGENAHGNSVFVCVCGLVGVFVSTQDRVSPIENTILICLFYFDFLSSHQTPPQTVIIALFRRHIQSSDSAQPVASKIIHIIEAVQTHRRTVHHRFLLWITQLLNLLMILKRLLILARLRRLKAVWL